MRVKDVVGLAPEEAADADVAGDFQQLVVAGRRRVTLAEGGRGGGSSGGRGGGRCFVHTFCSRGYVAIVSFCGGRWKCGFALRLVAYR